MSVFWSIGVKGTKDLHQLQKTLGRRIQFKTVLVQVGARAMFLNLHTQNKIAAYWNPLLQGFNSNHISIRSEGKEVYKVSGILSFPPKMATQLESS